MGCGGIKVMEGKDMNVIEEKENKMKKEININEEVTNINYDKKVYIKNSLKNGYINNDSKLIKENLPIVDNNKNDIINRIFNMHLELRKMHGCSKDLIHDKDLDDLAQKRAEKLLSSKSEIFSEDLYNKEVLGENILISDKILEPEEICNKWYNEGQDYNYEKNKFQKGTGHFTQLVWKNTKKVGFGVGIKDDKSKMVVVAYYYPAGNIFGEFTKNVEKNKKDININNE